MARTTHHLSSGSSLDQRAGPLPGFLIELPKKKRQKRQKVFRYSSLCEARVGGLKSSRCFDRLGFGSVVAVL